MLTAVRRGEDWFGSAVNIASRVAGVARPGEMVITDAVATAAAPGIAPTQLQPRGARRLRHLARPVGLFAMLPDDPNAAGRLPIDPVCRMAVDPDRRHPTRQSRSGVLHFCSSACAEAFDEDPDAYLEG